MGRGKEGGGREGGRREGRREKGGKGEGGKKGRREKVNEREKVGIDVTMYMYITKI